MTRINYDNHNYGLHDTNCKHAAHMISFVHLMLMIKVAFPIFIDGGIGWQEQGPRTSSRLAPECRGWLGQAGHASHKTHLEGRFLVGTAILDKWGLLLCDGCHIVQALTLLLHWLLFAVAGLMAPASCHTDGHKHTLGAS
jgi:hypothetical protein